MGAMHVLGAPNIRVLGQYLGIRPELREASGPINLLDSSSHVGPVPFSIALWWLLLLLPVSGLTFSPLGEIQGYEVGQYWEKPLWPS